MVHGQQRAVYAGRSAEPLFPAGRKTYRSSRKGERRVKLRSTSVPEHKFLVLRALLSTEPFCYWGLRVAFFTEYAYGVWRFLERTSPSPKWRTSRVTRRVLPAGYPGVSCDFRGVLHTHTPLQRTATSEAEPRLPEASTASAQQRKGQRDTDTAWDECSPPARDAKTLGLTWDALERAPHEAQPWLALHHASQAEAARESEAVQSVTADAPPTCALCQGAIHVAEPLSYTCCPTSSSSACRAHAFHLTCLASYALKQEPRTARHFCLPTTVSCPACPEAAPVAWADLVRRVYRRAELQRKLAR